MKTYPVALRIEGRPCLVVGGGRVAFAKARALHEAGAALCVVSPEIRPEFDSLAEIERRVRRFEAADADGMFLAFAATDDSSVNRAVAEVCRARGVLCSVADAPELSGFFVPSVMERGELTVAISTGGASPALAKRLRQELEPLFPEDYEAFVRFLRDARDRAKERLESRAARERVAATLASREGYLCFSRMDPAARAAWVDRTIAEAGGEGN